MTCPTKGRQSSGMLPEVRDSIWDEGSSHDRASVWAYEAVYVHEEVGKNRGDRGRRGRKEKDKEKPSRN
jgi:hypothetical protein